MIDFISCTNMFLKISDPLFADDMILYIENPKDSTRKLLELVNEYSRVAGCILVLTQLSFGEILAELKFLKWRRYIKLKSIVGTFKRLEFNS